MIRRISLAEFDSYNPQRDRLIGRVMQEVDWFEDADARIIGTVLYCKVGDNDWGYVAMGEVDNGGFSNIAINLAIESKSEAESQLRTAMISGRSATP